MKYEDFIDQAEKEGFTVAYRPDKDTWELQRLDEAQIFDSDQEAWRYVLNKALQGSELHNAVLNFVELTSPDEYFNVIKRY
jgi:hypothetical protein